MKIKDGAILAGLQLEMRQLLIVADKVYKEFKQELVITCGLDGVHSPGSLHYYGYALDFRTHYFTPNEKRQVFDAITDIIANTSPYYDIIIHSTHIHSEYDIVKYLRAKGRI